MATIGKKVEEAAHWLRKGELVAIPTETVYGLAGNALRPDTVTRIFEVKNRPSFDPLIVHIGSIAQLDPYILEWPDRARTLAETFWPGPLTLLFPRSERIPDLVTSGSPFVAIRMPAHQLTLSLLRLLDFPLAAPSANPFGYVSPTTARHVDAQLGDRIPYILDGGPCEVGIESTIVSFKRQEAVILRQGGISTEEIGECIGTVAVRSHSSSRPAAPGMLESHYAPRVPVRLLRDGAQLRLTRPEKTGALAFSRPLEGIPAENQFILSPTGNLREAAQRFFAGLRHLDELGLDLILAEPVPEQGLGRAINDRLRRAAAPGKSAH